MLDAVRFCLMEKQVLQRLHGRLDQCPLKDSVSAALRYHEQELWQPVQQTPLTQPRSTFDCILGFGGMFSANSLADSEQLFHVFHPSWGEWRTLTASHAPRMSNQGIAVLNNFVYLIGGDMNSNGFRAESRCWRWDHIPFVLRNGVQTWTFKLYSSCVQLETATFIFFKTNLLIIVVKCSLQL